MIRSYESGLKGEAQAEEYLCSLGMTCLSRRFRGQDGEIDLVMIDGETLVMVEVKYRPKGQPGEGLAAVSSAKQMRLLRAAQVFSAQPEWNDHPVRFDVVEINAAGVLHIPNAFVPGWY